MIRNLIVLCVAAWVTAAGAAPEVEYLTFFGEDGYRYDSLIAMGPDGFVVALFAEDRFFPTSTPISDISPADGDRGGGFYLGAFDADGHWIRGRYFTSVPSLSLRDLVLLPGGDLIVSASSESLLPGHNNYARYSTAENVHVFRIAADLSTYVWSTRLGESYWINHGGDLHVDDQRVYLSWSAVFPDEYGGTDSDAHTTALDLEDGTLLTDRVWEGDIGFHIEGSFPDGDLLLAGSARGGAAPVTEGVYITHPSGGSAGVLMKTTPDFEVQWCTYVSNQSSTSVKFAAVLQDGSTVFGFDTTALGLPVFGTPWSHHSDESVTVEIYLARLASDASDLLWAGYLGGESSDRIQTMAVDDAGNIVIVGRTFSPDFPTTPDVPFPENRCEDHRAFLSRFDGFTGALHWSTYLGEDTAVDAWHLALGTGRIGIIGTAYSSDSCGYPDPTPDAFDPDPEEIDTYILLVSDPDLVPLDPTPPRIINPAQPTLTLTGHDGATISFQVGLPQPARTTIKVHDLRGRTIATIHNGALPEGFADFEWDGRTTAGRSASRGTYCLTLQALDRKTSRTVMVR